jgi:flavin reductase (DIM6/NTAB) family NADH-FMN oxidoreductase RutF
MSDASTTFFTDEIAARDAYKLCSGLIVPRPIGWIGSLSADGVANLAPYSFFNLIGNDPMHVAFSPGSVGGGDKDSLANVKQVPEFTVNIVTAETVAAMNDTAATLPPEEDEFEHAGLTKLASERIRPPRVAEATATMECIVVDIVHVGRAGGGNDLVIGEVVVVHVADRVLDGTRVDQSELRAVGRHAGNWYSHATDLFDLTRPA